jgi:ubiquitin-conjugating enzyme E2 variant
MSNVLATAAIGATVVLHAAVCLLIADFIGGLLRWAEDTYLAPGNSAFLDRYVVHPNIDHHRKPGGIREGSYWEINQVVIVLAAAAAALFAALGIHAWEWYLTALIASQSNQIHAWGHTSNPPRPVAWLQRLGILQSAKIHAVHHKSPYKHRYCTTTAYVNPVLDRIGFWRGCEALLARCGVKVVGATAARGGF